MTPSLSSKIKPLILVCTGLIISLSAYSGNPDQQSLILEEKRQVIDRFTSLQSEINQNQDHFFIWSNVSGGNAKGEVYGILPYAMQPIKTVLTSTEHWCNATIIHINIKSCIVEQADKGMPTVTLYVGDEDYTEPELAEKIQYRFKVHTDQPDYMHITLNSNSGPMDTGNSSIDIKAVKLDDGNSLIRLDYTMYFGAFTRAILKTYLATLGRDKVGFTEIKNSSTANPRYIGGIEGIMERNTMRYYFAFDAYLAAMKKPDNRQFPIALNHWFDYTEKYRKQLYEIDRLEYINRKNRERQNQILLQAKTTASLP